MSFVTNISTIQEHSNYIEAKDDPAWVEAMQAEIATLEKNHMWDVTSFPDRKGPIGCKWVFKVKLKADGTVDRYKARVVAKGHHQIEWIRLSR